MSTEVISKGSGTAVTLYTDISQRPSAVSLKEAAETLLAKAAKYSIVPPSDADAEVAAEFRARLNDTFNKLDAERLATTEPARALVAQLNADFNAVLTPLGALLKDVDAALKSYLQEKQRQQQAVIAAQEAEARRLEQERQEAEAAEGRAAADAEIASQLAAEAATDEDRKAAADLLVEAQTRQAMAVVSQERIEQRTEAITQAIAPAAPPKTIYGTRGSTSGLRDNWKYRLINTPSQSAADSIKLVPDTYKVAPEDQLNRSVVNAAVKSQKGKLVIPGIEIYNDAIINSRAGS